MRWFILLFLIAAGGYYYYTTQTPAPAPAPAPVVVAPPPAPVKPTPPPAPPPPPVNNNMIVTTPLDQQNVVPGTGPGNEHHSINDLASPTASLSTNSYEPTNAPPTK